MPDQTPIFDPSPSPVPDPNPTPLVSIEEIGDGDPMIRRNAAGESRMQTPMLPDPTPPTPTPPTPAPASEPPKSRAAVPLVVSLLFNAALLVICLITAAKVRSSWDDGYYKGQIKVYTWMDTWNYGDLTYRMYNSEFDFKDKKLVIYIYNRNYFPDTTLYPDDQPPTNKLQPLSK
jgi:hypothetical protein